VDVEGVKMIPSKPFQMNGVHAPFSVNGWKKEEVGGVMCWCYSIEEARERMIQIINLGGWRDLHIEKWNQETWKSAGKL